MSYFHGRESPLSSALSRFTVLFGMGRGGSNSLWSSGMTCRRAGLIRTTNSEKSRSIRSSTTFQGRADGANQNPGLRCRSNRLATLSVRYSIRLVQSYRVKPHGQLVLVSLTCYHASTPSLSTSWSRTTLQRDQVPREISSSGKFPA